MARRAIVSLVLLALAIACRKAPRELVAGRDACDFCLMTISDVRFGAQIATRTGRIYTFDSIDCLVSFFVDASEREDVAGVWVADYASGRQVSVDSASFLLDGSVTGPMGRSLLAFDARVPRDELVSRYGGRVLSWKEVVAMKRSDEHEHASHSGGRANAAMAAVDSLRETIVVDKTGGVATISEAVARAQPGAKIVVRAGVYREPVIRIAVPLTLVGDSGAILDGGGAHELIVVTADDVTVRGLVLRNTGMSRVEDRAALRVLSARNCRLEGNRVENAFFGVYLSAVSGCVVADNQVEGGTSDPGLAGNGIHVWQSDGVRLLRNHVRGHRDGIYFEFVTGGLVEANTSEHSFRYGLHFMFSDSCRYQGNVFSRNGAGVAVMYTRRVYMGGNVFRLNRGSAAYGLLLKDISDSEIAHNSFLGNSIGLHLEGGSRNRIDGNVFRENGWALRILASSQDNLLTRNTFIGNSFDVGTNSRHNFSTFRENYWDRYGGYDLNRDGIGDAPHAPVRLFALIVAQSPPSLILQRSPVVDLLDFAERVIPSLTPETLLDERPLMRPPKPHAPGGSTKTPESAAASSRLPSRISPL